MPLVRSPRKVKQCVSLSVCVCVCVCACVRVYVCTCVYTYTNKCVGRILSLIFSFSPDMPMTDGAERSCFEGPALFHLRRLSESLTNSRLCEVPSFMCKRTPEMTSCRANSQAFGSRVRGAGCRAGATTSCKEPPSRPETWDP